MIDGVKHWSGVESCGCIHETIAAAFPELAPFIKWHLVSTDGPMHYVANTVYLAGARELDAARSAAIWPDATDAELCSDNLKNLLAARLPALMNEFKRDMLTLGFNWPERATVFDESITAR